MQKQSYNTGPQCKGSKNQKTQTHKLKNCSCNCNNNFFPYRITNNFFKKKEYSDALIAKSRSRIKTPCSVAMIGVPYLYLSTNAGITGKPKAL